MPRTLTLVALGILAGILVFAGVAMLLGPDQPGDTPSPELALLLIACAVVLMLTGIGVATARPWSRRLSHLALPSSETDAQGGSLVDAYQEVLLRRGLARRRVDLVGLRSVTLRRARTADVPAIARMHIEVLSSGSLQLLGEPFLRELFRAQVLDPDAVVVVADRGGEVIGYSSGVVSTSAFRRRFATRHGIRAGIVALPRLLDRDVARKLFETARYPDTTRDLPDAEHLFLGVRRGTAPGLGAVLTREVIDVPDLP